MSTQSDRGLTELLASGHVLAAGAFDPFSARIAELAGFEAIHVSGFAVETTQLAAPDLGIITLSELGDLVARIAAATTVPLIVDVDTGFGGVQNVYRTVETMLRSGASAIHIEDQPFPKRTPGLGRRSVVTRAEATDRIAAASAARGDQPFTLIGRSDADEISLDEVITRCNLYLQAGADLAMPMIMTIDGQPIHTVSHARQRETYLRLVDEISGPILAAAAPTPEYLPIAELLDVGVRAVILPTHALQASGAAMLDVLRTVRATGSADEYFRAHPNTLPPHGIVGLLDLDRFLAREAPDPS